jgi:peroxiredoxin (alkyl hydroperoxide reductase subunit C)
MPRIGDKGSDFEAVTTTEKLKFSDHSKGNWVILFLHYADLTLVYNRNKRLWK